MANFAAADLDSLVRIVKRKLKKIQYRPHLIGGCLAAAGLTSEPSELQLMRYGSMSDDPYRLRPDDLVGGQGTRSGWTTGVSEGGSVSSSWGRCLPNRRVRR